MEQIKSFPNNIKLMKIAGLGEPLLYRDIDKIVKYAVDSKKIDKVEIITNGSLLNEKLSEKLVEAGLKRLTISIQGTSAQKYKQICGVDIDFDKFLSNIKYFYDIRRDAEVRIKIIDEALDNKEDEKRYFDMFGDICDYIAIEHLIPSSRKNRKETDTVTVHGTKVENCNICPLPFYMLQVHPDGKVLACCNCESPHYIGDCSQDSLHEIWNSNALNFFRYNMLCGIEQMDGYCKSCISKDYVTFPEDKINKDTADRLKLYYE
ncbi:Coenzyme PQQ synthesis protein E [bioreactor metagenome]|uniref:Coenzyme PQQ synthesis protein E n=1 Tax=bioreactor metagenome TaxID=1076179 RepID=A0A645F1Y1_9ZZZZ